MIFLRGLNLRAVGELGGIGVLAARVVRLPQQRHRVVRAPLVITSRHRSRGSSEHNRVCRHFQARRRPHERARGSRLFATAASPDKAASDQEGQQHCRSYAVFSVVQAVQHRTVLVQLREARRNRQCVGI